MEVSAEVRWFWEDARWPRLQEWFCTEKLHGCAAGGGCPRTDAYLYDAKQGELGIKVRGSRKGVEVKGLVAIIGDGCRNSPFIGPIEIWAKWSSEALSLTDAPLVLVSKRRWLRKLDTTGVKLREIALDNRELPIDGSRLPDEGCNVEYTEISIKGFHSSWVSLGFEAFGPLNTVETGLQRTTDLLSLRHPPSLSHGRCLSYPAWLRSVCGNGGESQ